jgi:hypothetical protein
MSEEGIGEQLVVSRPPHHIVVPGDHPQGIRIVPVDGILLLEAAIIRRGIGDYVLGKHVIVHCHPRHNLFSSVSQVWPSALLHMLALSTGASRRQGPDAPLWDPRHAGVSWRRLPSAQAVYARGE